jgi:hypothetical protein
MPDYAPDGREKPAPTPAGFPAIFLATNPQGAQRRIADFGKQIVGQSSNPNRNTKRRQNRNKKMRRFCAGETGISWSEAVEDEGMLKVPAYNSKKEAFHHANSKCGLGLRIAPHNRVWGTGNKPLCKNCKKLNDQDAVAGLVIRST